jgi:hypothetical protein
MYDLSQHYRHILAKVNEKRSRIDRDYQDLRPATRSHAPRGNAVFDAPRRRLEPSATAHGTQPLSIRRSRFPHFLTRTVAVWLPVFTRPESVRIEAGVN